MMIVYGQKGQPVGSIDSDAVYDRKGEQILIRESDSLFLVSDGVYAGSYVSGVVYNSGGYPQGFTKGAKRSVPALPPRLNALPPRLSTMGRSVFDETSVIVPDFLIERLPGQVDLRDGFFS